MFFTEKESSKVKFKFCAIIFTDWRSGIGIGSCLGIPVTLMSKYTWSKVA